MRHKHYVAKVIDAALDARAEGVTVEDFCEAWDLPNPRTPTRWIAGFVQGLKQIAIGTERRLASLPRGEPHNDSPGSMQNSETRWQYAYVWSLLSRLRAACHPAFQSVHRSHFIFTL